MSSTAAFQAWLNGYTDEYLRILKKMGVSQILLTDGDAKLMKNKSGFQVSYNAQTAVDSETYLIQNYYVINQVTDRKLLYPIMEEIKSEDSGKTIEVVADKGYEKAEDMARCLEEGTIPHVITDDGNKRSSQERYRCGRKAYGTPE